MLFSSLTFLFVFLPFTIGLFFLAKDKFKNHVLLFASLFFYAWGEPKYIILMLLSIVVNYLIAKRIGYEKKENVRRFWLWVSVIINIGVLFVFKYLNFAIYNINYVFHSNFSISSLALPIGISFYTFQILSYVVDVYRRRVEVQNDIFALGTYIAFFPQLIAGPIVRYADIESQLKRRVYSLDKFCSGLRRFLIGFLKKVLIANNVAVIADTVFNNPREVELGFLATVMALLAYTMQIYYDFSGYSDMAIGLGRIFGFNFMENFNYPYSAKSIMDFWRRWHISLTMWFRDYLYIPLGGNRCSKLKWVRNFLIVWLCTGLWHGASWNFIIWGLYYAAILLVEKMWIGKILKKAPRVFGWLYMFVLVNIGWLFFRANSMSDLRILIKSLVSPAGDFVRFISNHFSITPYLFFLVFGFVFMFPVSKCIRKIASGHVLVQLIIDILMVVLFIIGIFGLINSSYNPFIYFRF